jgi:hypothetical protein
MEAFWSTLRAEMSVDIPFETTELERLAIFDYIETSTTTTASTAQSATICPWNSMPNSQPKTQILPRPKIWGNSKETTSYVQLSTHH